MSEIEITIRSVEKKCADRGIKMTRRRRQVLSALIEADSALSAYEIAELCNVDSENHMPAMSVYRILDFLREENFIHRLETANKYVSCSHISCSHEHSRAQFLICNSCRKVEEINLTRETIDAVEIAASSAGFTDIGSQLEVNGICGECQSA